MTGDVAAEFRAEPDPDDKRCGEVAALYPRNPFCTHAYVAARCRGGEQGWLFCVTRGNRMVLACMAFLSMGRLDRSLEIQSLPPDTGAAFWNGLWEFCRRQRITQLAVQTFGSEATGIPPLPGESWRRSRNEYQLNLAQAKIPGSFSTNHKRNVKSAERAGLQCRTVSGKLACDRHEELIELSTGRRRSRGEAMGDTVQTAVYRRLVESGAGILWQAVHGEEVLSSVLILVADKGLYYHSGGSAPEGMKLGASHFLFSRIALHYQALGIEVLNLGSSEEAGLTRFKSGFGAAPVPLEAAGCYLASSLRKKITGAIRLVSSGGLRALALRLAGSRDRYLAYTCSPGQICARDLPAGATMEKLDDATLRRIAGEHAELSLQRAILDEGRFNDAYAIRMNGVPAHLIWLIPAEHLPPSSVLRLKPGEAEITHAVTLAPFRGKGLYTAAIRFLACIAQECGIRRIYMITGHQNHASRQGIEKAGLRSAGVIVRLTLDYLGGASITFRRLRS